MMCISVHKCVHNLFIKLYIHKNIHCITCACISYVCIKLCLYKIMFIKLCTYEIMFIEIMSIKLCIHNYATLMTV